MSRSTPTRTPVLPPDRVLVAVNRDAEHELACALDYGVGAEIQTFSLPAMMEHDCSQAVAMMAARVSALRGPLGVHGAFIDTAHASPDSAIVRICRERYLASLEIAATLGARYVLFHSQYNTMLKLETYPELYHEASLRFWPEILGEAEKRGLSIYIENMFDDDPVPLRRLADAVDSPRFKLCLDIAHSQIYSTRSVAEWIHVFGEQLAHVHMNNSRGTYDDHLGLSEGAIDISAAIETLERTSQSLTYALETNTHTRESLEFLGFAKLS